MSAEPDEKPKLNLTLTHEGTSIQVKVKATMTFKKIFDAAEKKFGKDPGTLKFHYDGTRISAEDTPGSLGMEDGDQVDAFLEQVGGGSCRNSRLRSDSPSH
ncbi:ubiquitin-like protein [Moniliophthora roreri]|uniref:Ubiquitin-like domain-containing protein n=1 Tax=Moniliophthora roreri TaxID=221103 RepID=A0A0W0F899_MONRR|nr:ubiquitin-like protein [Moniliophthora roreri]